MSALVMYAVIYNFLALYFCCFLYTEKDNDLYDTRSTLCNTITV